MADDQRQQDRTPSEDANVEATSADEQAPKPSGLGRLTARFRRRPEAPDVRPQPDPVIETGHRDDAPQADASASVDRPGWLIPGDGDPSEGTEQRSAGSEDESLETLDDEAIEEHEAVPPSTTLEDVDVPIHATEAGSLDQVRADLAPDASGEPAEFEDPTELGAAIESEADLDDAETTTEGEFEETAAAAPVITPMPEGLAARSRPRLNGMTAHLVVLTGLATIAILGYLLIEPSPRWMLLLGAAAVVFGLDGTLRQTWRAPFSLGQETAPYLFVPALYMLGVPVLIEHNVSGELVLFVGLGASVGFGALAWAEVASVRAQAAEYDQARLLVTANTYLTGFAIFSLSYVFEISLAPAIVATAITASMLAVEVLREGEIDPMETLGLSLVTGIVLGELRWLLYYVPLDTYLAGLTLLLAFYLATGLLHSHVIRALNRAVAAEYGGIAAAGLALVIVARAAGLA